MADRTDVNLPIQTNILIQSSSQLEAKKNCFCIMKRFKLVSNEEEDEEAEISLLQNASKRAILVNNQISRYINIRKVTKGSHKKKNTESD